MIGNKAIAIMIALGVGLLAGLGGIYLYQQGNGLPVSTGQETATGDSPAVAPSAPHAGGPSEAVPQPNVQAEVAGAKPDAEPTAVPSFDVVMIDPSGEGVIAGRAAPGWQVSVQSSGTKVATATADAQGEWSAVLDKPLPAGDHALSLKIISPDGTRAVSSQELVRVEVGDAAKKSAAPVETTSATGQRALRRLWRRRPLRRNRTQRSLSPSRKAPCARLRPAMPKTRRRRPSPRSCSRRSTTKTPGRRSAACRSPAPALPGRPSRSIATIRLLATVRVGGDGTWSVVSEKKLATGQHVFRAERIDAATGKATAQAIVAMERLVPKPPEVVAAKETTPRPAAAAPGSSSASSVAALQSAQKEVYTIRRGDTLWAIAKRYLGSGLRYTAIFQDNREVINDPDLILPQQQVKVPTP